MARERAENAAMRIVNGLIAAIALAFACMPAGAQDFRGKTVTLIVGAQAGGGTDATGRLIAPFLTKYLPGHPSVVVQNVPGADGVVAANYFVQQVKADGLTVICGDAPMTDPIRYRAPQSHYDPVKFEYAGGIGRGGSMIVMNSAAERRLHDRSANPVTIGVAAAVPRSGQLIAAWGIGFLGWNAKWIVGYRGTGALMIAMQQGEIDMTATSNTFSLKSVIDSGQFKVLTQSGGLQDGKLVPRPEFSGAPLISELLAGKLTDPIAQKSFDYWQGVLLADKWLALPPGTPRPIVDVYRKAYRDMSADPEFNAHGRRLSEVFAPMTDGDIRSLVQAGADAPREAVEFLDVMLRKQGITGL
jgi:tripartite-type tricarboxylate transporter receptor subunit TctC